MVKKEDGMNKIVRTATTEQNVSQRTVFFELYTNGQFVAKFNDIIDAMDAKERADKEAKK